MGTVQLNNGHKIPIIGFGLAMGRDENEADIECRVDLALQAGYRHLDTAYLYGSEKPLGSVLNKWFDAGKVTRKDVFVVTKLPSIGMHPDKVEHFLRLSLANLQLEHVDLYLIHWPIGLVYQDDNVLVPKDKSGQILYDSSTNLELVWKEMETLVDLSLCKSIGVSNFSVEQIERICKVAQILPAVLQVETNLYIQQLQLRETCARHKIHITAYAPLGSPGRVRTIKMDDATATDTDVNGNVKSEPKLPPTPLTEDVLIAIAQKHQRTPAQIALRFLTQQNIAVVPKSRTLERMLQNINSLSLDLDSQDMVKLFALDKGDLGRKFDYFPGGKNHPEYPFRM